MTDLRLKNQRKTTTNRWRKRTVNHFQKRRSGWQIKGAIKGRGYGSSEEKRKEKKKL